MKLNSLGLALSLTGALVCATNAHAASILVIDDFNVTATGTSGPDTTADNIGVTGPPGVGGLVGLPGWARGSLFANLTARDLVETQICSVCGQAHFVDNPNSAGHGAWSWSGPAHDISRYHTFALDYSTDVPGADLVVTFTNGGVVVGQIWWADLPDTNNVMTSIGAPIAVGPITDFHIDAFSVGGAYAPGVNYTGPLGAGTYGASAIALDLNLDNARLIPEPAALTLLGLALAGLGARFRRPR